MNAHEALAELVALKKLKDEELRLRQRRPITKSADEIAKLDAMQAEYRRRKPLAWAAAERALSVQPAPRGHVLVNAGALQMVLNILRRGTPVQREAAEELTRTVPSPSPTPQEKTS